MRKIIVLFMMAIGLLWAGSASALVVPDASFEDAGAAYPGSWDYVATQNAAGNTPWEDDGGGGVSGDPWVGNNYANGYGYPQVGHDGDSYVDINVHYLYQTLTATYVEGEEYTLSVWATTGLDDAGQRIYGYFTDGVDTLYDSGPRDVPMSTGTHTWYEYDFSYTATAADAGKTIGIQFWGDGDTYVDDVTLVPEPMTLGLLGLGGLALIRRKRR